MLIEFCVYHSHPIHDTTSYIPMSPTKVTLIEKDLIEKYILMHIHVYK